MGLIKPTPHTLDYLETEVNAEDIEKLKGKPYVWLVRPCYRYKEIYRDCNSYKARFQQYYIYGEQLDCSGHLKNYNLCLEFQKTRDENLLDPIIQSELDTIQKRSQSVYNNKSWELRTSPPADFDAPLPEFIAKRYTSFTRIEKERQNMKTEKVTIFKDLVNYIESNIKK